MWCTQIARHMQPGPPRAGRPKRTVIGVTKDSRRQRLGGGSTCCGVRVKGRSQGERCPTCAPGPEHAQRWWRREEISPPPPAELGDLGQHVLEVEVHVADGDADEVRGGRVAQQDGKPNQHPRQQRRREGEEAQERHAHVLVAPAPQVGHHGRQGRAEELNIHVRPAQLQSPGGRAGEGERDYARLVGSGCAGRGDTGGQRGRAPS